MSSNVKIALASPMIRLGDVENNARLCAESARLAEASGANIVAFPELTLTGATCGDLFYQDTLLKGAEQALFTVLEATRNLEVVTAVL